MAIKYVYNGEYLTLQEIQQREAAKKQSALSTVLNRTDTKIAAPVSVNQYPTTFRGQTLTPGAEGVGSGTILNQMNTISQQRQAELPLQQYVAPAPKTIASNELIEASKKSILDRLQGRNVGVDIAQRQGIDAISGLAGSLGRQQDIALTRQGIGDEGLRNISQQRQGAFLGGQLQQQQENLAALRQQDVSQAGTQAAQTAATAQAITSSDIASRSNLFNTLQPFLSDENNKLAITQLSSDFGLSFNPDSVQPSDFEQIKQWAVSQGKTPEQANAFAGLATTGALQSVLTGLGVKEPKTLTYDFGSFSSNLKLKKYSAEDLQKISNDPNQTSETRASANAILAWNDLF